MTIVAIRKPQRSSLLLCQFIDHTLIHNVHRMLSESFKDIRVNCSVWQVQQHIGTATRHERNVSGPSQSSGNLL